MVVANLVNGHGEWCLDSVKHFLSIDVCNQILSLSPPRLDRPRDRIAWSRTTDEEFSTVSAYESLIGHNEVNGSSYFKLIWQWQGPERIRVHMWKMALDALVTNRFRFKRGMTPNNLCPVCNLMEETILHVARDCREVAQAWCLLLGDSIPRTFFDNNLLEWLSYNLKNKRVLNGVKWSVLFGAATSSFWQARNERVFHGKVCNAKELSVRAKYQALAFQQSFSDKVSSCSNSRDSIGTMKWSAPAYEFAKLNCDGAVDCYGELAAVGGVLRDHHGSFIFGFASASEACSIVEAEVRAIHTGI